MFKPLIEFCMSNVAQGAYKVLDELEKDYDVDVMESSCLSYCTLCSERLFAVVEGEVIQADTPEELLKKIYDFINEHPLFN